MLNYTRSTMCINFYFSENAIWMGYWTRGVGTVRPRGWCHVLFCTLLVVEVYDYVELYIYVHFLIFVYL